MRIAGARGLPGRQEGEFLAFFAELATRLTQFPAIMLPRENRDSHRGLRQTLA